MRSRIKSFSLALLTAIGIASAQGVLDESQIQAPADPVLVRLDPEIQLTRLIELAASSSRVSIQYQPEQIRQQVRLLIHDPLTPDQLWELMQGVLQSQGYALVEAPSDDGLIVVPIGEAARTGAIRDEINNKASFQSVVLDLEHVRPGPVLEAVSPLLARKSGSVINLPNTDTLILSGPNDELRRASEFIQRLDQQEHAAGIRAIVLEHMAPSVAIELISQYSSAAPQAMSDRSPPRVFQVPGTDRVMISGTNSQLDAIETLLSEFDLPGSEIRKAYALAGYPLDEVVSLLTELLDQDRSGTDRDAEPSARIVRDRLSGSVIVTGTSRQHQIIEDAVDRLRALPASALVSTRVYEVRHRPVEEVGTLIDEMLRGPVGMAVDGESAAAVLQPQLQTQADSASIIIDQKTNSIIATGSPGQLARVEQMLPLLDRREAQVEIEVIIVSLSESETRDLGVELQYLIDDAGTMVGLTSLFGLSNITPASASALAGGSGGTGVVLDPGAFSAVVVALETINDGRTLSRPRLLVSNNEEATLDNITQQPFVSVNASDTIATTSQGGYEDAGTVVNVTPQIAAGDHLLLRYSIESSAFVGESASSEVTPPRQVSSITSTATIPDGYTIVLGGVETESEAEAEDKTPLLGDLPVIGNLFKTRSTSTSRQRFYVFIRASIMRGNDFEELRYLSDDLLERADLDQSWPRVQPRVIR